MGRGMRVESGFARQVGVNVNQNHHDERDEPQAIQLRDKAAGRGFAREATQDPDVDTRKQRRGPTALTNEVAADFRRTGLH